MQLARMPLGPHSTAMLRAMAISAALEIEYTPMVSEPMKAPSDEMNSTAPSPRSAICGITMLQSRYRLFTLAFIT